MRSHDSCWTIDPVRSGAVVNSMRPLTAPNGLPRLNSLAQFGSLSAVSPLLSVRLAHHDHMLAKRVIPCLDVDRGRVVKGTNFVNLRDAGDPVEVAARYEKEGADELVFLDITASHEGRDIMLDVVRRTAEQVFMPLTVGGGIRTIDDIRRCCSPAATRSRSTRPPARTRSSCARRPGGSAASASW